MSTATVATTAPTTHQQQQQPPQRPGGYVRRHADVRGVEERNAIVLENIRLVGAMVKTLVSTRHHSFPDLMQTGYVALIRAAALWDESRGIKFSTYAGNAIRKEVLKSLRTDGVFRCPDHVYTRGLAVAWLEKHQQLPAFKHAAHLVDQHIENPAEPGHQSPRWWVLRLAERAQLSERFLTVIKLRLDGLDYQEIATRMGGVARQTTRQWGKRAMQKMREAGLPEWDEVARVV